MTTLKYKKQRLNDMFDALVYQFLSGRKIHMGDRSNVVIDFGEGSKASKAADGKTPRVYLYSHWAGPRVAVNVRDACKEGKRTDDSCYFARIVFDKIIGDDQGNETGHGISPMLTDNEYNLLVICCDSREVWAEDASIGKPIPGRLWKIEEFGKLSDEEAMEAMR